MLYEQLFGNYCNECKESKLQICFVFYSSCGDGYTVLSITAIDLITKGCLSRAASISKFTSYGWTFQFRILLVLAGHGILLVIDDARSGHNGRIPRFLVLHPTGKKTVHILPLSNGYCGNHIFPVLYHDWEVFPQCKSIWSTKGPLFLQRYS